MKALEISDLEVRYGNLVAVQNLSLSLDEGETLVLSGRNGSGKSTVLLAIMGVFEPVNGTIRYESQDLRVLKPWDRVRKGISILPENRRLFEDLTVEDNLSLAAASLADGESRAREVMTSFPTLEERRKLAARLLSGGERQLLAWARLLVQRPRLALLDDPFAGLDARRRADMLGRLLGIGKARLLALPVGQEKALNDVCAYSVLTLT